MFNPEIKYQPRRLPVEQRIERCRDRIKVIEHELAKERRLLSLLFEEERLAALPPEPVLKSQSMTPKFIGAEKDAMILLEECRETAQSLGLDATISDKWSKYYPEAKRQGVYMDVAYKANFWLEQLKATKR